MTAMAFQVSTVSQVSIGQSIFAELESHSFIGQSNRRLMILYRLPNSHNLSLMRLVDNMSYIILIMICLQYFLQQTDKIKGLNKKLNKKIKGFLFCNFFD